MEKTIKVLVVDDSRFMRQTLVNTLQKIPEINIVGEAGDGVDALKKVQHLNPDIVTLDIDMPRMDGLSFLKEVQNLAVSPQCIVISASHEGNADNVMQALSLGAFECIEKDKLNHLTSFDAVRDMLQKVIWAALREVPVVMRKRPILKPSTQEEVGLILVGASTGGPKALQVFLTHLNSLTCPLVIVQHMPEHFTDAFIKTLQGVSEHSVHKISDNMPLKAGQIYVAPGGERCWLEQGEGLIARLDNHDDIYCPSVSRVAMSASDALPKHEGRIVAVMLTGMGEDGLEGYQQIHHSGGIILAQTAESSSVYGMPRAIIDAGIAHDIGDPKALATKVSQMMRGD